MSMQPAGPSSQASLTLIFGAGGSANKRYSLDRDALIIGKGRNCDLSLEAADISTIHCVISRSAGGYSIRDCDSRSGIKINGDRLKEATLHDGDLVQVGPFSFRLALPPKRTGSSNRDAPARLIRLERKRLNLAKLALSIRKRMRQPQPQQKPAAADPETSQLLEQGELLTQRLRDCEQRAEQLDQAERALANDRAALARDTEEFQQWEDLKENDLKVRRQELEQHYIARHEELERDWARRRTSLETELPQQHAQDAEQQFRQRQEEMETQIQQRLADTERDLAARRQQLEQEMAARQEQLEQSIVQRQQALEKEFTDHQRQLQHDFEQWRGGLAQQLSRPEQPDLAGALPALDDTEEDMEQTLMLPMADGVLERTRWLSAEEEEEARRLLIRRRELDFYSQYLRRTRGRLQQEPAMPVHSSYCESSENHMAPNATPSTRDPLAGAQAAALLERQQAALERTETVLEGQRTALAEMLAEFRQLNSQPVAPRHADVAALQSENEQLRQQLTSVGAGANADLEALVQENEQLRHLLDEHLKDAGPAPKANPALHREMEQLRSEVELMQKLLDEKNVELEQARQQSPATVEDMPAVEDVDSYEAELVQFRRQLEAERGKLAREFEALQIRNQELDEGTREVEMQLSRERAELARERMRMDRLREEIQADLERLQRNGNVMEKLASVTKLREEIVENRQKPPATTPPPANDNGGFRGGFRSLRNRG